MEKVERKKSKLLDFQKALNTHFLEIFESKSKGVDSFENQGGADLGLEANASSLKFFLPLKDLKNISMDNKYESIVQTNSWLLGFNQSRGEIYTIIDLNKVFELIIDNKQDIIKSKLTSDSRIAYLKDEEHKVALCLNKLQLNYTAELTLLFKYLKEGNHQSWILSEDIELENFDVFVKKENMSKYEWDLIEKLKFGLTLDLDKKDLDMKNNILFFVKDIYLDSDGHHPLFVLNIENLMNYLDDVIPY